MEQDFERELREALEEAEKAEVVCLILPLINQILVYDSRTSADDPPRLTVSPPLGSAERRLRQINQARPHLRHVREMAALPWTGSIDSMARSPIWELVTRRMVNSGFKTAGTSCSDALDELRQCERRALIAMIQGQGPYQTIWSRAGSR